jgi:hypothetical protein
LQWRSDENGFLGKKKHNENGIARARERTTPKGLERRLRESPPEHRPDPAKQQPQRDERDGAEKTNFT